MDLLGDALELAVVKEDAVAGLHAREGQGQRARHVVRVALGGALAHERDGVAGGELQRVAVAGEGAGARLRSGQLKEDARRAAARSRFGPHAARELGPHGRTIVGGVDARDVHSGHRHRGDQRVIARRGAGERDHDPGGPRRARGLAEQGDGARVDDLADALTVGAGAALGGGRRWVALEFAEHAEHPVDRAEHVALGAPE